MPSSGGQTYALRSEEHTSELQSHDNLACRLLLEQKSAHQPRAARRARPGGGGARRRPPRLGGGAPLAGHPARRRAALFFLMIGGPPISAPFPSTALFR